MPMNIFIYIDFFFQHREKKWHRISFYFVSDLISAFFPLTHARTHARSCTLSHALVSPAQEVENIQRTMVETIQRIRCCVAAALTEPCLGLLYQRWGWVIIRGGTQ